MTVVSVPFLTFAKRGVTILGLAWLILCLLTDSVIGQSVATSNRDIPLDQLLQLIESSLEEDRVGYQLALLKRFDATVEQRENVCRELIAKYAGQNEPAILAPAYAGQGRVLADQGKLAEAVKLYEKAEGYARQIVDVDPLQLFRTLCNRAAYMNALGDRPTAASLLREAIELAKSDESRFDIAFAYSVLGHIAEASGAIDKAFDYFRLAFDSAVKHQKTEIAAQVGINIIELAISEGDLPLASDFIAKAASSIEKSVDPRVRHAFKLRQQDLKSHTDPQAAVDEIQRMLAEVDSQDTQSRGLMYLSLAACHFRTGKYTEVLTAADSASELLKPIFRSWALAQIWRFKALFGSGQTQAALDEVERLLQDQRLVMVHRIELLEFRSTLLASLDKYQESLESLSECRKLESQRDTERAQELAQFIKSAYDDRQKEMELSLAKERQAAAEAQADLSFSIAQQQTVEANYALWLRNGSIALSVVTLLAISLYWRAVSKRHTAAALATRERELNEVLKQRLSDQAAELQQQVSTRQQLELAMERKFRDEALGKLTGGVAHDFNNLLTVILHSIELIRNKTSDMNDETRSLLEAIVNAAESGSSIVNQLLVYTRQQPLEPRPLKVSTWLATTRTMHRQMIGKSIEYVVHDNASEATLCIDAAQLTTAVINLLANARDAVSTSGGSIELNISQIEIDTHSSGPWKDVVPGKYCLFEVCDNGKGMSPEEVAHACEPFFTTKQPGAGTGLGLSTVSGFVKQSGGELQLSSTPGQGTVASFILPLTDQKEVLIPAKPDPRAASGRNQVLLVEDQNAVRTVLAAGLKSIGYEVTQAASADEAVEIIQRSGMPQILLSDVRMPGSMNGVELRRWVLNRYPQAHVVLMSGYRDLDTEYEPDILFMQKPVKLQDLHQALSGTRDG